MAKEAEPAENNGFEILDVRMLPTGPFATISELGTVAMVDLTVRKDVADALGVIIVPDEMQMKFGDD